MEKTEVIVDTCFLEKLSSAGKRVENINKVLSEFDYTPVVHPYIYEHELSLKSYLKKLVDENYIRVVRYDEFQKDESDKLTYEYFFEMLYEDLRQALDAIGSPKQMDKLDLAKGQTIYSIHKQGSNMGDVHLMLMASFLQMPILLTEDSDIDLLRSIAKRRIKLGSYSLQIFDGMELIKQIAQKENSSLSVKELELILNEMGERRHRAEVKELWRKSHSIDT